MITRSLTAVLLLVVAACGTSEATDPTVALSPTVFDELPSESLEPAAVDAILAGEEPQPEFNSDPATSGPHAPQWARCGVYRQEIPDIFLIHSLKRGAVVIHYQPSLEPAGISAIEDLVADLGAGVISAPRSDLESPIVLAAWTRLLPLASVDSGVVEAFVDQFSGLGPVSAECPLEIDETA
jgi:hypothetical protein